MNNFKDNLKVEIEQQNNRAYGRFYLWEWHYIYFAKNSRYRGKSNKLLWTKSKGKWRVMIKHFCDKCEKEMENGGYSILIGANKVSGSYALCRECLDKLEEFIKEDK